MAKISTLLICFSLLCLLVGSSLANPAPMPFDDLELPELDKRQENNSTSTSSSTSTRPTTSSTTSIITPPTTTTTTSRTTPTTPTTSSTPTTPTTPAPPDTTSTTPTSTSTTPRPPAETTSTDPAPSTTQSEDVVTASPTTRIVVATIYTTLSSNGQVSSYVTSSTTVETPTGTALPSGSNNGGGGSGLSTSTRNTIIGVVVGVGGALLVGGLAIVAWRLKRKRVNPVDEDDLMRRDGSPLAAGRDMHPASPETSPFKATLDQYHKPPGVVNTSSNF